MPLLSKGTGQASRNFKAVSPKTERPPNPDQGFKKLPITPILSVLGILGFIALAQGHATSVKGHSREEFERERELSKGLVEAGTSFKCRFYHWPTDFAKGECGHVSAGVIVDGVAQKHFGHWPVGAVGNSPLSFILPGSSVPAKSLEEDMEREDYPPLVLEFDMTPDRAAKALEEIDHQHRGKAYYSMTPVIGRTVHDMVCRLPAGPIKPKPVENCATISHKVAVAAGIINEDLPEYQVPTNLFRYLQNLENAKSVAPKLKIVPEDNA